MKTIKTLLVLCMLAAITATANAAPQMMEPIERDTVIIELENGSRIVIYTKDRIELKKLQAYDINEMIRDLNQSVQGSNVDYMELENKDGSKYLIDSPKVLFGEGVAEGDTVMITEQDLDNIRIRIGGMELAVDPDKIDEWDGDWDEWDDRNDLDLKKYSYTQEETQRTRDYFNLEIGINNWLQNGRLPNENNEPYSVKNWGSWYVGLNWINSTRIGGPLFVEWGGGFNMYNWKLEDTDFQFVKGDTRVEMVDALPDGASGVKSKLSATYINASLVPVLDFSKGSRKVNATKGDGFTFKTSRKKGFRMGGGMYASYRLGSKSKYIYKDGTNRDRNKESDHFYLENFRYGVRGQVGFGSVDFFVLYDLNQVFAENKGPNGANLHAFTFGITI